MTDSSSREPIGAQLPAHAPPMAMARASGYLAASDVAAWAIWDRRSGASRRQVYRLPGRCLPVRHRQILPLGPTGYGDSPYQTFSAFAGNPMLVSPELLVEDGLLPPRAIQDAPSFPSDSVDYGNAIPWKQQLLERAFDHFQTVGGPELHREVNVFAAAQRSWLEPFALFMALKDAHGGRPWIEWEKAVATRMPRSLARWQARLERDVQSHIYSQYLFPAVEASQALRQEPRLTHHRRCAHLRGARQRRLLHPPRAVSSQARLTTIPGRRCATRLLQQDRPALGESSLQVGRACGRGVSVVDSVLARGPGNRRHTAAGPLQGLRRLLGDSRQ